MDETKTVSNSEMAIFSQGRGKRRGFAEIKDVRSSFEAEDTLTYQKSGDNECNDSFGGKYLSFIKQNDDEWAIILKNPVTGSEFIAIDNIKNRT